MIAYITISIISMFLTKQGLKYIEKEENKTYYIFNDQQPEKPKSDKVGAILVCLISGILSPLLLLTFIACVITYIYSIISDKRGETYD